MTLHGATPRRHQSAPLHVLLDLDGTLVDPKQGIIRSIQYALQSIGVPVPPSEELHWVIGPPLRTSFSKLLGSPVRAEEAVTIYRKNYLRGAMYEAVVYPTIPAALEALAAAGCRLLVATSKPHHYARRIVQRFGLEPHFAAVYGPELDGTYDNKADLIAHIAAKEGLQPDRTLMIGDRAFDITAAIHNGMRAIGVTWGYGSAEELAEAKAAAICTCPSQLAKTALNLLSGAATVQLSHR